jgi:hypothetical protein
MVAKAGSKHQEATSLINGILRDELNKGLRTLDPFVAFKQRVFRHRDALLQFVQKASSENKKILGYGASTKGNVILQFCNITTREVPYIAEVNKDKFGCFTPGTLIPIVSETEARAMKPDYFMVLPWHFKENIVAKEADYLTSGGRLFFPLPELEAVGRT